MNDYCLLGMPGNYMELNVLEFCWTALFLKMYQKKIKPGLGVLSTNFIYTIIMLFMKSSSELHW